MYALVYICVCICVWVRGWDVCVSVCGRGTGELTKVTKSLTLKRSEGKLESRSML